MYLCIDISGTSAGGSPPPFTITERTQYDLTENVVYLEITENLGKNQVINVTSLFQDNPLISNIDIKDVYINKSYQSPIYGSVEKDKDNYATKINTCDNGNVSSVCKDNYYNSSGSLMSCSRVEENGKKCFIGEWSQIGTETKYDYQLLDSLNKKKDKGENKIKLKMDALTLPKNSKIQLKYKITHPTSSKDNTKNQTLNKYDILVSSLDGIDSNILDPTWFNTSWNNYKPVYIQELAGGNEINYTVSINVTYANGMQNDFDDVRFVDETNTTTIPYYREYYADNNSALFRVKVNITANANTTINMFYNNSAVTTGGSIYDVAYLGEDCEFTDDILNHGWSWVGTPEAQGANSTTNQKVYGTRGCQYVKNTTNTIHLVKNMNDPISSGTSKVLLEFWGRITQTNQRDPAWSTYNSSGATTTWAQNQLLDGHWKEDATLGWYDGAWKTTGPYSANTWYYFRFYHNVTKTSGQGNLTVAGMGTVVGSFRSDGGQTKNNIAQFGISSAGIGTSSIDYFDNIIIRKYVEPEPVAIFGTGGSQPAGGSDTCTPPGSGSWNVQCSDNCSWSTVQQVPGDLNITGAGILNISAKLNFTSANQYIYIRSGCTLNIFSGGSFN